jgi:hypothetical protein
MAAAGHFTTNLLFGLMEEEEEEEARTRADGKKPFVHTKSSKNILPQNNNSCNRVRFIMHASAARRYIHRDSKEWGGETATTRTNHVGIFQSRMNCGRGCTRLYFCGK